VVPKFRLSPSNICSRPGLCTYPDHEKCTKIVVKRASWVERAVVWKKKTELGWWRHHYNCTYVCLLFH